jgi:hypothetical protein
VVIADRRDSGVQRQPVCAGSAAARSRKAFAAGESWGSASLASFDTAAALRSRGLLTRRLLWCEDVPRRVPLLERAAVERDLAALVDGGQVAAQVLRAAGSPTSHWGRVKSPPSSSPTTDRRRRFHESPDLASLSGLRSASRCALGGRRVPIACPSRVVIRNVRGGCYAALLWVQRRSSPRFRRWASTRRCEGRLGPRRR